MQNACFRVRRGRDEEEIDVILEVLTDHGWRCGVRLRLRGRRTKLLEVLRCVARLVLNVSV